MTGCEEGEERAVEGGFEVRPDGGEPHVCCGTWVKVALRGERFWCRVLRERGDGTFDATVENDLLRSPTKCGDVVVLGKKHVLETASDADRAQFRLLCALLGDPRTAALLWRDMRAKQGLSAPAGRGSVYVIGDGVLTQPFFFT